MTGETTDRKHLYNDADRVAQLELQVVALQAHREMDDRTTAVLTADLVAAEEQVKVLEEALLTAASVLRSARLDTDTPDSAWEADKQTVIAAANKLAKELARNKFEQRVLKLSPLSASILATRTPPEEK
jgi:hypothetical protein